MTATLRAFLVNSSRALGVEPQHLKDPAADGDVQTALLKDVIALREMGHAEHSLALLDVAAEAGLASDWIGDNRARALLALGRNDEAQALLQSLSGCGTEAVAAAAREQLEGLGAVQPASAPAATAEPIDPTPVLEDAIRLRESGEAEASLQVLEQALAQGLQSPWIDDNRARALVQLERRAEALAIWETLAQGDDEGLRAMAEEMAARQRQELALTPLQEDVLAASELAPELKAVLDAAIALRESGQVEASLAMLDRCSAEGNRSPWLAGNRARALLLLDRQEEARAIWQALAGSVHEAVSSAAQAMLERLEAERLQALRAEWLQMAQAEGESLPELDAAEATVLADLERPVLEASIRLRDQGTAALSLRLLEAAREAGVCSAWIDDNRARALVQLNRRAEALAIWEALAEGDDEGVRAMATEMAERQRSKLVEDLNGELRQLLQTQGRVVQHLPETAPAQLAEMELPLLKEAIALREANDVELSLQVLEAAVAAGLRSGWIDDNRARALVNLERYSEAVTLWQALLTSDTPALQEAVASMLELNEARGVAQGVLLEVDRLLEQADSPEQCAAAALEFLTDALLQNPDSDALQEKLQSVAVAQKPATDGAAPFAELKPQRLALEGFDAFLSVLEQRYATASAVDAEGE